MRPIRKTKQTSLTSALSLGALSACGSGSQQPTPMIVADASGRLTVQDGNIFISSTDTGFQLSALPISLSPSDALTASADVEDEIRTIDLGETLTIYPSDNAYIFTQVSDFITLLFSPNVSLEGAVWLVIDDASAPFGTIPQIDVPETIELTLGGGDSLVHVTPSAHTALHVNGTLHLRMGAFDFSHVSDLQVNSLTLHEDVVLALGVHQLSGSISSISSGGGATLHFQISDASELSPLRAWLMGQEMPEGISIAIEPVTLEAARAIDVLLADESLAGLGFANIFAAAGENDAPVDIIFEQFELLENSDGQIAGALSVIDIDANDAHTFTVSDERFVVEGTLLKLATGVALNFETEPEVQITVTATDLAGASVARTISIDVIDVNEAPIAINVTNAIDGLLSNATYASDTQIGTIVVTDDALGYVTYLPILGDFAELFYIRGDALFLRGGVQVPDIEEFSLSIAGRDFSLSESSEVSTAFVLPVLATNSSLNISSSVPPTVQDRDLSSTYSAGDRISFTLSETIDLQSLTLADLVLESGNWGNSAIVSGAGAQFGSTIVIELGSTASLPLDPFLTIGRGTILDSVGRANLNEIAIRPPELLGAFDIVFSSVSSSTYASSLEAAARFWEQIITTDLPDIGGVDDLEIAVNFTNLDGRGGTLAEAAFTALRPGAGGLPYRGIINVDTADAPTFSQSELTQILAHEIAHILGFGTLWAQFDLANSSQYFGLNAVREYQNAGGSLSYVPLESDGGPGTAGAHWDENIFGDELMTGFYDSPSVLTSMTIGAMEDLGYDVNYGYA